MHRLNRRRALNRQMAPEKEKTRTGEGERRQERFQVFMYCDFSGLNLAQRLIVGRELDSRGKGEVPKCRCVHRVGCYVMMTHQPPTRNFKPGVRPQPL